MHEQLPECREMFRMVRDLHSAFFGPAGEPEKGLFIRFDRVEQDRKKTRWFNRMVLTGVAGAVLTSAWTWFSGFMNSGGKP